MSWGDAQTRYDPIYHRGLGYSLIGWEKLRQYARVKGGKRIPLGDSYAPEETGLYYLRVDNLSDHCEVTGELKWLRSETFKELERYRAFTGDVLVSIAGTIGRTTVFDEKIVKGPTILTENCAKLRVGAEILPEYLMLLLASRPLQAQMERDYIQTTIPKLGLDRIRQLRIPAIPRPKRQQHAIDCWHSALGEYRQSLGKASDLLASIDDYLLSELGITMPPEPENTIANRIFTAQRRELAGWRFDPLCHSFKLWHAIEAAHIPHKKLGLCCHYLKTGFAAGGDMQLFDEDGVIQLRPTNIDTDRELVFDRNIYLDKALFLDREGDVVQVGEVLFNNTNSQELVGKTVYMDIEDQPFFCSNHITRIMVNEDQLNAEYLTALLNTYQRLKVFFSLCTNWNNQSGVNVDLLRQLPIPVPDMEKQNQIAKHIRKIRQEAKHLRQQAEAELETAKHRIETMLLGEAN